MNIPYFGVSPAKQLRISEQDLRDAIAGNYRFDREKFEAVVRACPCGTPELKEKLIEAIVAAAGCDDGSIDMFKSGYAMGGILKAYPNLEMVSDWVRDLNRLPIYRKNKESDEQ